MLLITLYLHQPQQVLPVKWLLQVMLRLMWSVHPWNLPVSLLSQASQKLPVLGLLKY